jgi:hypothetical protein
MIFVCLIWGLEDGVAHWAWVLASSSSKLLQFTRLLHLLTSLYWYTQAQWNILRQWAFFLTLDKQCLFVWSELIFCWPQAVASWSCERSCRGWWGCCTCSCPFILIYSGPAEQIGTVGICTFKLAALLSVGYYFFGNFWGDLLTIFSGIILAIFLTFFDDFLWFFDNVFDDVFLLWFLWLFSHL